MSHFHIRMKPQGKVLQAYMESRAQVSVIIGALGSGKTWQSCQKILQLMCEQPADLNGERRSRWYAIRNTNNDLFSTTIKDWRELFGELGEFKIGNKAPPTHYLNFSLDDGTKVVSELLFIALDRDDSIRRLRGAQLTGVWLNELKELNKGVVMMADLRHGRYPQKQYLGWHGMIADTNAPDQDHWLYQLAEKEKPKGWDFFKQPGGVTRDGVLGNGRVKWIVNPDAENLINLPDGYYEKGLQAKSDDWIAVNLANEYGYVTDGMPVYKDYNDNLHCRSFDFIDGVEIYRGWDFGTPACVLAQLTPKGRLIAKHEWTTDQTTGIDQFSDIVLDECAKYKKFQFIDVGDPAGESRSQTDERSCFDILRDKGVDIQGSIQNTTARIEAVRHYLSRLIEGTPAFILDPACNVLRQGFQGGYQLRRLKVAGEKYTSKPDKNKYSHPHDCLQYIAAYIRHYNDDQDNFDYEDEFANSTRNVVTGY